MSNQLANGSFSAGSRDAAATVDVYSRSTNQTINSIQDIRQQFDSNQLANLKGGDFSGGLRPVVRGINDVGMLLDKNSLISRVIGSAPGLMAGFKDLTSPVSDNLLSSFEDKDGVFATIGGVVSKISGAVVDNVKALGSLIGDVVGDGYHFVVGDNDGLTALYTGIIKECHELGIPSSFSDIVSTIRDPNIVNRVTSNILPSIVKNSDTQGLLGAATGTAMGVVKAVNPQILNDFSRQYTYPLNNQVRDMQREGNAIFGAYDAVDRTWDKGERLLSDGTKEQTTNITNIQGGSRDAKAVIRAAASVPNPDDTKDRSLYMLADVYKPTSVTQSLSLDFPHATLSDDFALTGPQSYYAEKARQDAAKQPSSWLQ